MLATGEHCRPEKNVSCEKTIVGGGHEHRMVVISRKLLWKEEVELDAQKDTGEKKQRRQD